VVRAIAYEHPQFIMNLARVVAQRKRDALTSLGRQSTMSIIARIAQVLLPFATAERGLSLAIDPLPNLTQSQIAASAGTVKEVAARAIAELERLELLKRERGHVCYLDRQRLADFVRSQS
jgi:CRP-like cAMP-binding protein